MHDEHEELLKAIDRYFLITENPNAQEVKKLIHKHNSIIFQTYETLQRSMVYRREDEGNEL